MIFVVETFRYWNCVNSRITSVFLCSDALLQKRVSLGLPNYCCFSPTHTAIFNLLFCCIFFHSQNTAKSLISVAFSSQKFWHLRDALLCTPISQSLFNLLVQFFTDNWACLKVVFVGKICGNMLFWPRNNGFQVWDAKSVLFRYAGISSTFSLVCLVFNFAYVVSILPHEIWRTSWTIRQIKETASFAQKLSFSYVTLRVQNQDQAVPVFLDFPVPHTLLCRGLQIELIYFFYEIFALA